MNTPLDRDASRLADLLKNALDASLGYLGSIDRRPPATAFVRTDPLERTSTGYRIFWRGCATMGGCF